jgi:hypothetical protein
VVRTSNPGATRILRAPLAAYEGRPLAQVPGWPTLPPVQRQFDAFLGHHDHMGWTTGSSRLSCTPRPAAQPTTPPAWWRAAPSCPMPQRLLVFDDISEIVSAQRAQAWGEVARRLAHEIKNPLTPIQLSAERLEMKLSGKLPPRSRPLLTKSVKTIVDQVDAMKRLVNEFRDYARLPAAELQPLDVNAFGARCAAAVRPKNACSVPVHRLGPTLPPHRRATPSNCARCCTTWCKTRQDATAAAGPGRGRGSAARAHQHPVERHHRRVR